MQLNIGFENHVAEPELPSFAIIEKAVKLSIQPNLQQEDLNLCLTITHKDTIQRLNREYRKKDKPTNVLSFPTHDAIKQISPGELGDVILCLDIIKEEAQNQGKSIEDHFIHMVVHGCLHLQGFDHTENAEAEIMEDLEINILKQMGISNPYHKGS